MSLEFVDHLARLAGPLAVFWFGLKIININWEVSRIREKHDFQTEILCELLRRTPPVESDLYPDEDDDENDPETSGA